MSDTTAVTPTAEEQAATAAATQQAAEPQIDPTTGKFIYTFDSVNDDGETKQYKYLYKDHLDLANQLVDSKKNGDKYIYEVKSGKRTLTPAKHQEFKPVAPTTDEDKKRRDLARKDFEDELGAPIASVREQLKEARMIREYTVMNQWALNKQAEGYVFCPENGKAMAAFLEGDNPEKKPLDQGNVKNLELAFETLRDAGKLKLDNSSTTESTSSSTDDGNSSRASKDNGTQPSRSQSGVKPGTFEGGAPRSGSTDKQPLTAQRFREIDLMSRDQYLKLQRTNRKEFDAFLLMKFPKSAQA